MITYIYIAITAALLGLTIWNLYRTERSLDQLTCALVAIPLILRVLGLK